MSESFTFSFTKDDAERSDSEHDVPMADNLSTTNETTAALITPQHHSFDEILTSLPASISYTFTPPPVRIPRRELYDIRAQLMSEADPSRNITAGLNAEDIEPGVYEGGFKTWECAVDLARFMLGEIDNGRLNVNGRRVHVIEMGAGTARPSAALLHRLLTQPRSPNYAAGSLSPHISLTVADYNASVLSLATGPNIFLTCLSALDLLLPESNGPDLDLEPSQSLLAALRTALHQRNVSMDFFSGAWGREFAQEVQRYAPSPPPPAAATPRSSNSGSPTPLTVILASETIYQPAALPAFVDTVQTLLREARANGAEARAYIAAKRVYFGVGGGVEELRREAGKRGGYARECWGSETELPGAKGVGRCILEVTWD